MPQFRTRRSVLSPQIHLPGGVARGVDTLPHSITRSQVTSGYDLVVISMGKGGWVFKIIDTRLSITMLEPKCNKQLNINISQVNDLFTPKPAKLYKHIH